MQDVNWKIQFGLKLQDFLNFITLFFWRGNFWDIYNNEVRTFHFFTIICTYYLQLLPSLRYLFKKNCEINQ